MNLIMVVSAIAVVEYIAIAAIVGIGISDPGDEPWWIVGAAALFWPVALIVFLGWLALVELGILDE